MIFYNVIKNRFIIMIIIKKTWKHSQDTRIYFQNKRPAFFFPPRIFLLICFCCTHLSHFFGARMPYRDTSHATCYHLLKIDLTMLFSIYFWKNSDSMDCVWKEIPFLWLLRDSKVQNLLRILQKGKHPLSSICQKWFKFHSLCFVSAASFTKITEMYR